MYKRQVNTFKELVDTKYPIKLSVGVQGSSIELLMRNIFAYYGVTYEDIASWGGKIEYLNIGDASTPVSYTHLDLRLALQDIAGCEITVSASSSMTMMSGNDINVEVSGDDYDTLEMIANDLKDQIAALPDAVDVESSLSEAVDQVKVSIRREAAAQ